MNLGEFKMQDWKLLISSTEETLHRQGNWLHRNSVQSLSLSIGLFAS